MLFSAPNAGSQPRELRVSGADVVAQFAPPVRLDDGVSPLCIKGRPVPAECSVEFKMRAPKRET